MKKVERIKAPASSRVPLQGNGQDKVGLLVCFRHHSCLHHAYMNAINQLTHISNQFQDPRLGCISMTQQTMLRCDQPEKINYPGSGNNSQMAYDGEGLCTKIVEVSGSTITSTRQFVWAEDEMKELRDGAGTVLSKYYGYGQSTSGNNYFYTRDQLTSVREMLTNSGTMQSQYGYSPFGQVTNLQSGVASDFQFAGYYFHGPSLLNLTVHRAYQANIGRWINRDPIDESGGRNLFRYVRNCPVNSRDPDGLSPSIPLIDPDNPFISPDRPVCIPRNTPWDPDNSIKWVPNPERYECYSKAYSDYEDCIERVRKYLCEKRKWIARQRKRPDPRYQRPRIQGPKSLDECDAQFQLDRARCNILPPRIPEDEL